MRKLAAVAFSSLFLVHGGVLVASADTTVTPSTAGQPNVSLILFPAMPCDQFVQNPQVKYASRAIGGGLAGVALVAPGLHAADVDSWNLPASVQVAHLGRLDSSFAIDAGNPVSDPPSQLIVLATMDPAAGTGSSAATCVVIATEEGLKYNPLGGVHVLRSDTTRRTGVVTPADIRATVMSFLGQPLPTEGSVLESVRADTSLFARYQAHQRIAFPIQVAAGIAVTLIGLLSVALVALRRRIPRVARTVGPWLTLTPAVLASALLAAGSLPQLTYATVLPFVVIVTAAGAAIPLLWRHRGVLSPPAVLGIGVLVFFLIEAVLGWPSTLTTLFGGTALDGVRFYGLPNVFEGLIYGSGLYVAATRKRWKGVALLFALGLFAGFPGLGADLGGALACFAAAGLWLALAEREERDTPLMWRLVQGGLLAFGGLIVVLVANRLSPTPTHITAFTESGGGGILHTIASRLGVGWDLLMRNPFGFIPVIGILVLLAMVLKPPTAIRESFAAYPGWRTAMLVLVLTSVVAYFANDTGVAASGQGFAMALAGLLYVPLAMIPRKMDS